MRRFSSSAWIWIVLGAAYFLIPLLATFLFSIKDKNTGHCCSLSAYGVIVHDPAFWHALRLSLLLALETIVVSLVLFVPTIYWVHLKLPRLRPVISFLALIPFVVPPIILVVGLLDVFRPHGGFLRVVGTVIGFLPGLDSRWFYSQPWGFLVAAYVILAFPYVFFSLDAGFRAIDVHTLTEASLNLGASWRRGWTMPPATHGAGRRPPARSRGSSAGSGSRGRRSRRRSSRRG